jgi:hypothetical protein
MNPQGNGLFVLYYGDPLGSDSQRILRAAPNFVVLGAGAEEFAGVASRYHDAGVRVLAYVALGYGKNRADAAVQSAMSAGFDGIFFDETDPQSRDYNLSRADNVRAHGPEKLIVMNPGHGYVDATIFEHADIVCVENQWQGPLSSSLVVPPWRWMAAQGDPAALAPTDLDEALARLASFRACGGFWYFSGPHASAGATHVRLADWFEEFAAEVKRLPGPAVHRVDDGPRPGSLPLT